MRSRIQAHTTAVVIGMLMGSLAHGQGSSQYAPPGSKQMLHPGYPPELAAVGQEGWVQITCMVSRRGKAYQVAVVDSNGFAAFEKNAVANMDLGEFRPATLGGREVDGGTAKSTRLY